MIRCPRCFQRTPDPAIHLCPTLAPVQPRPTIRPTTGGTLPARRGRPTLSPEEREMRDRERAAKAARTPKGRPGRKWNFAATALDEADVLHGTGLTWRQVGEAMGVDWNKLRYSVDHRRRLRAEPRVPRVGAHRGGRPGMGGNA